MRKASVADSTTQIIVFDGMCNLCSGGARLLQRPKGSPRFALVPMQTVEGRAILAEHGLDPDDPATFLVLDGGRRYTEADAWIHVAATLRGFAWLTNAARMAPRPWRNALYRVIARNRYRWFGRRSKCYLPR
jgi:predicted DCC family thiol-disulfide oxidoreductase YuxK